MRLRVIALFAAAVGLATIPAAAEAGHRRQVQHQHPHHSGYNHRGWAEAYTPFYHRHYRSDWRYDPYAYDATKPRYYPYYNSGHWRPTHELRYRRDRFRPFAALPPYYQAWGYPARDVRKVRRRHY